MAWSLLRSRAISLSPAQMRVTAPAGPSPSATREAREIAVLDHFRAAAEDRAALGLGALLLADVGRPDDGAGHLLGAKADRDHPAIGRGRHREIAQPRPLDLAAAAAAEQERAAQRTGRCPPAGRTGSRPRRSDRACRRRRAWCLSRVSSPPPPPGRRPARRARPENSWRCPGRTGDCRGSETCRGSPRPRACCSRRRGETDPRPGRHAWPAPTDPAYGSPWVQRLISSVRPALSPVSNVKAPLANQ